LPIDLESRYEAVLHVPVVFEIILHVSVIIPTFRRQPQLAEALASVLRQRDVPLQVIVIDDCPDGSAEEVVVRCNDPRVLYLRNPVPSGGRPAAVRNFGMAQATGGLIHFLDDDDRAPDGHYAAMAAEFTRHPNVGVIFGRIAPFGVDARQVIHELDYFARAGRSARVCRLLGPRWGFGARMLCGDTLLVCSAAMVRRRCFDALNGFDESLKLMEDVDFYGRAIRSFGARFVDRVTLHYRIGPSLMHRPNVTAAISDAYRSMQSSFRRTRSTAELRLMQVFCKFLAGAAR
jgi:glycosyltransferase involved in cell wall biosynthesis